MEAETKNKEQKRTYEKPKLLTIELTLNEVLAVGCKSDAGGGAVGACELTGCVLDGS